MLGLTDCFAVDYKLLQLIGFMLRVQKLAVDGVFFGVLNRCHLVGLSLRVQRFEESRHTRTSGEQNQIASW